MISGMPSTRQNFRTSWTGNPSMQFEEGLEKTVDWYLANEEWMQQCHIRAITRNITKSST